MNMRKKPKLTFFNTICSMTKGSYIVLIDEGFKVYNYLCVKSFALKVMV